MANSEDGTGSSKGDESLIKEMVMDLLDGGSRPVQ